MEATQVTSASSAQRLLQEQAIKKQPSGQPVTPVTLPDVMWGCECQKRMPFLTAPGLSTPQWMGS